MEPDPRRLAARHRQHTCPTIVEDLLQTPRLSPGGQTFEGGPSDALGVMLEKEVQVFHAEHDVGRPNRVEPLGQGGVVVAFGNLGRPAEVVWVGNARRQAGVASAAASWRSLVEFPTRGSPQADARTAGHNREQPAAASIGRPPGPIRLGDNLGERVDGGIRLPSDKPAPGGAIPSCRLDELLQFASPVVRQWESCLWLGKPHL